MSGAPQQGGIAGEGGEHRHAQQQENDISHRICLK
jgi:hypothetical protein